jgi:hypothetical protein
MKRSRVLFLCIHNSARSQMAEGLLRQLGGIGLTERAQSPPERPRPKRDGGNLDIGLPESDVSHGLLPWRSYRGINGKDTGEDAALSHQTGGS